MVKTMNLHRPSYGQSSRDICPIPKRRKQTSNKAPTKRVTLRANKDGIVPTIFESWEDPIIKGGEADCFINT